MFNKSSCVHHSLTCSPNQNLPLDSSGLEALQVIFSKTTLFKPCRVGSMGLEVNLAEFGTWQIQKLLNFDGVFIPAV